MRSFGFALLGLVILLMGGALVVFGLTAKICSAHYLGTSQTCPTMMDISQVNVGIVFIMLSSPIFVLAGKTNKGSRGNGCTTLKGCFEVASPTISPK